MLTRSVSAVCFFSAVAHITYLRHHPSLSYNCLQLSSLLSVHLIVQRYFSVTASTGQNGLQSCPKCQAPLQDWISLQEAQSNPSLVSYFQSVDTMLSKLTLAIRYQTTNLREQAAYYKSIAHKQSAALKGVKKELAELRAMKKSYEALQRENAALKNQLAGVPEANTTPFMQSHGHDESRLQESVALAHRPDYRPASTMPIPPARISTPHHYPSMHDNALASRSTAQAPHISRTVDPVHSRSNSQMQAPQHGFQSGPKRSAEDAGLSVPHVNLPPIMRESQLPPGAMSSAQLQDAAQEEQFHDDASVGGDGIERLQTFRFHRGEQSSAYAPRTAPRQSRGHSPREAGHATRRSSSRSSRSDLPAIEETPFQRNSIRSEEAHPPEAGPSRISLPPVGSHHHQHALYDNRYGYQENYNTSEAQVYQNPDQSSVQASALQPPVSYNQSGEGRSSTFRPLVARPPANNAQFDNGHHHQQHQPSHQGYVSPPVHQQQRAFQPMPTARPATAQAGSAPSQQHFGRAFQISHTSRPATAQAGRRTSVAVGNSNPIRPMAIPPISAARNGGTTFKYQPER
ncbi:hypothetical protein P389DRAFT_105003 [Cystobasidium minutum MCA 4210]|uniref:uncharacterized protein n=1 Tax=Cystobasidium minutum MCA 4210 TaxID=1397322 RepID=UPI0034CD5929|eukprot:jgi/Rhomi1/105003/CE105002_176